LPLGLQTVIHGNANLIDPSKARHQWWFTPVILGTQEAKIRRIIVQEHPEQTVPSTLFQNYSTHKKGWQSGSSGRVYLPSKHEVPEFKPQCHKNNNNNNK
jgi:hypothetical protein